MKYIILCCLLAWLNAAAGRNPMENPGMFEGDMLGVELDADRNAIPRDEQKWPYGIIPYIVDPSLQGKHLQVLNDAMTHIQQKTCIKFVPRTNEFDYVRAFYDVGCYAHWGRVGMGEQRLSLGAGCEYLGTAIHEWLHAIGFEHEHNRPDRDNYINIYWDNIAEESKDQFRKRLPNEFRLLTPFDYDSIMLYGSNSFAKSPNLITMVKKDGNRIEDVFNKIVMAPSDIKRVKMLYNCP